MIGMLTITIVRLTDLRRFVSDGEKLEDKISLLEQPRTTPTEYHGHVKEANHADRLLNFMS